MDENDFIFCVLHKSQGEFRIRNFFYWMSGNDFQTLHQHSILVCADLQRFLLCARPSEVPVFNPLVQKQLSKNSNNCFCINVLKKAVLYGQEMNLKYRNLQDNNSVG